MADGNAKWCDHFRKQFGSFLKIRHISSYPTHGYLVQRTESMCSYKDLHVKVQSSLISNTVSLPTHILIFDQVWSKNNSKE
jgi:hypothetical protein